MSEQENPQPAMPTAAEVAAYTETWGTTVDEVAEWLRDHDIQDHPEPRLAGGQWIPITRNCVVAMGIRAHFPALDEIAGGDEWSEWSVLGDGGFEIINLFTGTPDVAQLPSPVVQLIRIADTDRGTENPRYPFLYGPSE